MAAIVARFKEPSSWAGIAVLLSVAAPHIGLPIEGVNAIVNAGAAVCSVLAIVMKEKAGAA